MLSGGGASILCYETLTSNVIFDVPRLMLANLFNCIVIDYSDAMSSVGVKSFFVIWVNIFTICL